MTDVVKLTVEAAVATIQLDRPPVNAVDDQLLSELRAAAEQAAHRDDIRAVVLYGGPRLFAAGADIKEMATATSGEMTARSAAVGAAFNAVAAIPKPVVAAITGYALGGGCELALCADYRVAGVNARLGLPEILLGIIPGAGGTQRLSRAVGLSRAKELVFTGRLVGAEEAARIGLVDEVTPPEDVYDRACTWARQFSSGPALALRAAKEVIDAGASVGLGAALTMERQYFVGLFATDDQREGMLSFIERGPGRAPFRGR